jgi:hypothetical protein
MIHNYLNMPRMFPEKGFIDPANINKNIGLKVITHAVSNKSTFFKIVKDKVIELPSVAKPKKKTPFVEELYGLQDCNYFSAGFDYNSKFHQWDFAFLFRKSILKQKQFNTFKSYIVAKSWFVFMKFLRDNDLKTLLQTKQKNVHARKYINRFLETGRPGLFWKFEKALIWAFNTTRLQKKVKKIMIEFIESKKLSNNYAPVFIGKHYYDHFDFKEIEICSTSQVSLNCKQFVGVYVQKARIQEVLPILKKHFSGNILVYDGEDVKKLNSF